MKPWEWRIVQAPIAFVGWIVYELTGWGGEK